MFPRNEQELIEVLRGLAEERPGTPLDAAEHANCCVSLSLFLAKSGSYSGEVPHLVWHFLSDADIRATSPEYAQVQREQLLLLITEWARAAGA